MTNPQIAKTILVQLGGNRFLAMTGAKNLLDTGRGLQMKVGRNPAGITHVTIELTDADLYHVKFQKVRTNRKTFETSVLVVSECDDVYDENLRDVFESATGLATHL